MQVTHIPDPGVIESSVRFFVKVAAEAFTLDNVFVMVYPLLLTLEISHATQGGLRLPQPPQIALSGSL